MIGRKYPSRDLRSFPKGSRLRLPPQSQSVDFTPVHSRVFSTGAWCCVCVCVCVRVQLLAGVATGKKAYSECLKLSGGNKTGCRSTKKGYVTVNQGKDAMACIHTHNGAGICWPGGKSGYNESIQVSRPFASLPCCTLFSPALTDDGVICTTYSTIILCLRESCYMRVHVGVKRHGRRK